MINEKVKHVRAARAAGHDGKHTCHWPGCTRSVPPAMWGCGGHWFKLPQKLRSKIWAAYRIKQEDTKTPSAEYVAVAREAQEWIAANYPEPERLL